MLSALHFFKRIPNHIKVFIYPPRLQMTRTINDPTSALQQGREQILTAMMRTSFVLGLLIYVLFVFSSIDKNLLVVLLYAGLLVIVGMSAFGRLFPFRVRVALGASMLLILSITDMLNYGMSDDGRLYLVIFSVFVLIFRGARAGLIAIGISSLTIFVIGTLISKGIVSADFSVYPQDSLTVGFSALFAANWLFAMLFAAVSIISLLEYVERTLINERAANLQLEHQAQALNASLERETKLAAALQTSLERERALSELRSRVITTVSHEFRTPLSIINGATLLLNRYNARLTADSRAKQLSNIADAVSNLTTLVQDVELVDQLSRVELQPTLRPIDVAAACEQLVGELQSQGEGDDRIRPLIDPIVQGQQIRTDWQYVCQIVQHLISNALKYSDASVELCFSIKANRFNIKVVDQGIGVISAEEQRIFELFERGSNVETVPGLGLGLYVAQNMATQLGGQIELSARPDGAGTCAWLRLPLD